MKARREAVTFKGTVTFIQQLLPSMRWYDEKKVY